MRPSPAKTRRSVSRTPDAQEVALAEKFLRTNSSDDSKLPAAFCQSLLASAEFRFAD